MKENSNGLFSRRGLAGAAAAAPLLAAGMARAALPQVKAAAPAYYRFSVGQAEVTVVSDGIIYSGDPRKNFTGLPPADIAALLSGSFLDIDRVIFDENVVVVNTGAKLVLFDTGTGPVKAFGPNAGKLLDNLRAAGISPADVDAVVLTHGHADHICGLVMNGGIVFENAQFYINKVDHDFWLETAKEKPALKLFYDQAVLNLVPIRERLTFIEDGQEFLPGMQAMLAPGHTPGHMMFMLTSGGKTLALLADTARHHILNVEAPRLEFVGDIDPPLCVATRLRVFDMLVGNNIPILSYHYPFPGVGHLAKWGERYRYYPAGMLEGI